MIRYYAVFMSLLFYELHYYYHQGHECAVYSKKELN